MILEIIHTIFYRIELVWLKSCSQAAKNNLKFYLFRYLNKSDHLTVNNQILVSHIYLLKMNDRLLIVLCINNLSRCTNQCSLQLNVIFLF